jgi:hypothetical protein
MAKNNTPGAITEAQLDAGIAAWFGVAKVSPERAILRERMHAAVLAIQANASLTGSDGLEAKAFDAFLCRAWGETDLPSAELVAGWEGVRRFMIREWLGEQDATDYDGTVTLDRLKEEFDEHEDDMRGGAFEVEFEIGGVSIERVCGFAAHGAAIGSAAAHDVLAERQRQISAEGWTPEHDDEHGGGEMARAAATYALYDHGVPGATTLENGVRLWPWDWRWLKPKSARANLVRSGALIVAEIERLDRAAHRAAATEETKGGA